MASTATLAAPVAPPLELADPLESGERLTRAEFERRYEAMPEDFRAELIEGVVYVSSPVRIVHFDPENDLGGWLALYKAHTPGTQAGGNGTIRLDLDNEPQPDLLLRILPERGGQSGTSEDDYVEGAPELVVEVAASSTKIDLHAKKNAYRRNGVREYLVWRVLDNEVDWFILREGRYDRLAPDEAGIYRSEVFPGLWLDVPALLRRDLATVLDVLQQGIRTPEHQAFAERLAA